MSQQIDYRCEYIYGWRPEIQIFVKNYEYNSDKYYSSMCFRLALTQKDNKFILNNELGRFDEDFSYIYVNGKLKTLLETEYEFFINHIKEEFLKACSWDKILDNLLKDYESRINVQIENKQEEINELLNIQNFIINTKNKVF